MVLEQFMERAPQAEVCAELATLRQVLREKGKDIGLTSEQVSLLTRAIDQSASRHGSEPATASGTAAGEQRFRLLHETMSPSVAHQDDQGRIISANQLFSDISEREQAEEALRERDEQFRALIGNLHSAVALVDEHGRFVMYNPAFLRMFGLSSEVKNVNDINDQDWSRWQVFEEDGTPLHVDQHPVRLAARTGQPVRDRLVRVKLPSGGQDVWMLISAEPLLKPNGQLRLMICTYYDITDRKRTEEALRQSEARLQIALEAADLGTWELDLTSDKSSVRSMRHDQIFGYSEPQAEWGQQIAERHVLPEDLPAFREAFRRARETGVLDFEVRVRWPDGSVHWIAPLGRTYYDQAGRAVRMAGVVADVTVRKEEQEKLHGASQRLKSHVENSPLAVVEFDTDLRIIRWTESAQRVFGWTAGEVLGKGMWEIPWLLPEDLPRIEQVAAHLLQGNVRGNISPNRNLRNDGSVIWCEWYNSSLHDERGKLMSIFSLVLDVTERVKAQEAMLRAKEEAEAASKAKDHFLAVLSHELRTPLTPVATAAQLLETQESLSADQRDLVAMIRRNVDLEARLIDDLLDLTRISRGKFELHLSTVDVHECIGHVVEMVGGEAAAKRLTVRVESRAPSHHVQADAARLQQILWNLVKNAVKFTPVGGDIIVRTGNPEPGRLAVAVQDTGIGIGPDLLPRLFMAFEQGGKDVTRQFGGLGLGLAISKGLAQLHHGTLTASSPGQGKGALFTLSLPVSMVPSSATVGEDACLATTASDTRHRLLLVEDHVDTSKLMERLLRGYGYEVVTADSVAAALRAAEAHSFALLVSDIGLPDGSGLDLMRQLQARYAISGIALSGFGMEEDINRSRKAGFAAHLTKPVNFQRLREAIQKALADSAVRP